MPEILSIKNVTAHRMFAVAQPGIFHHTITAMPMHPVDEIVIRSITWNGVSNDDMMHLLWSNITNDIVGSFCGASIAPIPLGTRIVLTHPPPNVLEFKLMHSSIKDDSQYEHNDAVVGDIAVHMEFISYKKRHIA
jgi:hypothetical protein